MPRRRGVILLALVTGASLTASCTAGGSGSGGPRRSSEASPFRVESIPDGYTPGQPGQGDRHPAWGDDTEGTDEPFTVLAPERADAASPDAVVVSVTGFEGLQGGLDQASTGYVTGVQERFEFEGTEAIYTPPRIDLLGQQRWADLVAVRGDDLAVRVTSRKASRARLIEVLQQVRPSRERTRAPSVPDPPAGLHRVASAHADAVAALRLLPGGSWPASTHGATWRRGAELLGVATIPGHAAELDAFVAYGLLSRRVVGVHRRDVGGRPGIVVDEQNYEGALPGRTVLVDSSWGDLVLVVASTGEYFGQVAPEHTIVDVAASVRRT